MKQLIEKLEGGGELLAGEIGTAVESLIAPEHPRDEKKRFLVALQEKGESPQEVAAFVTELLQRSAKPLLETGIDRPLIDICGTGGDKVGLFNVSTTVVFVLSAMGASVLKHGNRGITSKSGGADVLEALGVPVDLPPEKAGAFLTDCGFIFFFAPIYHPAFREIVPVRKELASEGRPTIFNILGPLLNPANPDYQLAGVFHSRHLDTYGEVFRLLGRKSAWAVHGKLPGGGGIDEISALGPTEMIALEGGELLRRSIDPAEFGFPHGSQDDLVGGDPAQNAAILRGILDGSDFSIRRSMVEINAAGAACASGIARDLPDGMQKAKEAIDSGAALAVLEKAIAWK